MLNRKKSLTRIEKQACEWLAIMRSDCKTAGEVEQFQAWLEADARHQAAYDEVHAHWLELSGLRGMIDPASYQKLGAPGAGQRFAAIALTRPALAAAAGLLLTVALLFALTARPPAPAEAGDYTTSTAEIKEVKLPDASQATLGALSAMEVAYSETERRVALIAGEAFFAVEPDAARPFVVVVADAEIRALGTKFEVRRSRAGVRVSVLEGKVEVTQTRLSAKRVLAAQERVRVEPSGRLSEIQPVRQSRPGLWRQGRLVYENATLSEVMSDADRYYAGNIIIDAEDLRTLPVSAAFRTDQIQEMMDALSLSLPISVRKLSNGDLVIRHWDNSDS